MCGVIISIVLLVCIIMTFSTLMVSVDWWFPVCILVDYGLAVALCVMTIAKHFMR